MATGGGQAARGQGSLRRRLQSSQEAQHRQAVLVRKLQAKVLQYQARCRELEQQLEAGGGSLLGRWEAEDHSLENALHHLEEEQQRCENLAEVNALLRAHLNEAKEVNSALKEDIGKLTADWMRAREELELKESEWSSERELYDSHLRGEHKRLLGLWCQVVTFRRHFLQMKTATDRDLSELKAEQLKLSGSILVHCSHLSSGLHLWESLTLGRAVLKGQAQQQEGQNVPQKMQGVKCLQVQEDLEKKELQDRVLELSALLVQSQKQNEEKERALKALNATVQILEASQSEYEASWTKSAKGENLSLQKLIKDIAEMVLDGSGSTGSYQHAEASSILSPCLSSLDAEHALLLVQEALAKRQGAAQALKEELFATKDSVSCLMQQHRQQEEKCRKLQQSLEQLEEECRRSSSHQQHLQALVETLRGDCASLEQTREELQQQLEAAKQEASELQQSNSELQQSNSELQQSNTELQQSNSELQQSNTELQQREDSAQGEKMKQQQTMEEAHRAQELLLKDLAALEGKHSLLQSELVVARETLEESHLQRDLLKQEKQELAMALEKAEQSVAELTGAQNKMSAERADLQVAAAKMSSISEALALDKVQLNKLLLQLEQENDLLSGRVGELERAKLSDLEKLNLCERRNEELSAEKARLEQLLEKAEEQQEGLQLELVRLAEEKAETQGKFNQVCHQQELASSGLEQLQQEAWRQGQALAKAAKEKEVLAREKAALEVRLAALQRDRHSLAEQLAEARSVKESLESSLFETQQHLSQLEITRSQLEMQLHTVTQAKEVIQGEVRCLQCELEAERSLLKQERERLGQQLLQAEQQWDTTLRLRQAQHQEERSKLLQDLAREQEGHHSELQRMLEQWEREKAEAEGEHERKLLDMKQKVAAMQAQREEEQTRAENAKQEVLLEKESEKNAVLETLLQTQEELREAYQQLEQLQQELKEQQQNGQHEAEKLQAELQETQEEMKAVEKRHEEAIKTVREEVNVLLQQRDALHREVEELTSQLAACEESQQEIGHKAQQDLSEAQELSRQKGMELVHLQKLLDEQKMQWEEVEHQNKELQGCLQALEGERTRWEEVEQQNVELQAVMKALEGEKASLTLALEEKDLNLRTLEESSLAQLTKVSQLVAALHQAQQLHSEQRTEMKELHTQVESLQGVLLEKEAELAAREEQLLQALQESQAGEHCLRDSLSRMEAEKAELHSKLCSTESRAKALATECQLAQSAHREAQAQLHKLHLTLHHLSSDSRDLASCTAGSLTQLWLLSAAQGNAWAGAVTQAGDLPAELTVDRVAAALQDLQQHLKQTQHDLNDGKKKIEDLELELSKRQVERDHLSAQSQELQKQLAQSQEETQVAEHQKSFLQASLQEEAVALKEEARSLQQGVASLERKLHSTEQQRRAVLQERDSLQALKEKLAWDIKLLQESVTASESRANTATDMNHCLEHQLQTTLSVLNMKNEEMETLWEKIQVLHREAAEGKALQEKLTAILSEREGEVRLYQEQVRVLEKQKEMHQNALDQVREDMTEGKQKAESQQKHIEELEKQQEEQRVAVGKMSKDLEERDREIRSQQEQIQDLEKQQETQKAAARNMSRELEEREQQIRSQQEQIQDLEKQQELQKTAARNRSRELEEREQQIRSQQELIAELEKQQELQEAAARSRSRELEEREQQIRSQQELIAELEKQQELQKASARNMSRELEEREQQIRSQQEQIQDLEKQQELQITASKVSRELEEREQQIRSQQELIAELEKQQETQRTAARNRSRELEEREQQIRSQQELIAELEKQRELQKTAVSRELEEREQQIRSQQELIAELEKQRELQKTAVSRELEEREQQELKRMTLEPECTSQVRSLLLEVDHMKGHLKEKNTELLSLTQQVQELEQEREQVQALHASLEHLRAVLKDRESQCESQRDQLRLFQQYKDQQEEHLQELHSRVEKMTLSLAEKDQELELQQKQIQEAEVVMGMQLKTVQDQLEQALETLKEKDRLLETQKEGRGNSEGQPEEQGSALHRGSGHTKPGLKEEAESQEEVMETFQEQDADQQKEVLQPPQVALKEQGQEIFSLREQCEACKEREGKQGAEQAKLQAARETLKDRERRIRVLEEAVARLQQQKEEAEMQIKAQLQALESSLGARDQEIGSWQEPVQELRGLKESESSKAERLRQEPDRRSQMEQQSGLEFLRQAKPMDSFQLGEGGRKGALTSGQKQVVVLQEAVRKRDEDNGAPARRARRQEGLRSWQALQLGLPRKEEEVREHREQEQLLEEALPQGGEVSKAQGEQGELEVRAPGEELHRAQHTLGRQRGRVRSSEEPLAGREEELRRQSELLKQLTSAWQWKSGGESLQRHIQKLQQWEEEEAERRRALQERDSLLAGQRELSRRLAQERKAKEEELQRVVAALRQTESAEIEWKEKAQGLGQALAKSELTNSTLREEIAILQSMVSDRDKDRFHLQVSTEGGESLAQLLESQRLQRLQRAVAKLELEKVELKQLNAELKRTLEQVECERRRLKRCCSAQSLPGAGGFPLSQPDQHKLPASRQGKCPTGCCHQLAELQNQVSLLGAQLAQERKHKQDYIRSCARTSQELSDLHQELSDSLAAVVREPQAAVLEAEARKLDRSLTLTVSLTALGQQAAERQPLHSTPRAPTGDGLS
ncbi:centrosome-associated protein CEP250 [Dryobates pubescens]|uniref:centrosome-associated protein CEP250 n=1 Tax=Dryobates pubescens TaxID=118200 RepID=UPI0023B97CBF|nr:centrosome-associated protein CEP250 [Dryobates pubescens]